MTHCRVATILAGLMMVVAQAGCKSPTANQDAAAESASAAPKDGQAVAAATSDGNTPKVVPAVAAPAEATAPKTDPTVPKTDAAAPKAEANTARTFYWSMEEETPDVYPAGTDSGPNYYPPQKTMRTTAQAHGGKYSLDLSGQPWRQATFDNPTDNVVWTPTDQGAIVLWWKFTGEFSGGMLMQITGKCKADAKLDTNDGRGISFHGNNELRFGPAWFKNKTPWVADRWYKVTARWRSSAAPYFSLQVDDNPPVVSDKPPAPIACKAWHHLLWGNDTRSVPSGLYMDDVEIWNSYDMTPAPGKREAVS